MEFVLGCNFWASNAGADMWREFDINAIEKDLKVLSENGVTHIRAFPNWRDFQPVIPLMKSGGTLVDYCLESEEECENDYYLSETMMERFSLFLKACEKYNVKVIVGLITGWMSGRLYVPPMLYDKNLISDPLAQFFQQLFIRGFVSRFKDREVILAWDLGNECNCMAFADRINAANWTAMISNAIRAEDNTRLILSGMDGLYLDRQKHWQIKDQAMFTDVLTTHPYPYWCEYTNNDKIMSLRTTMHATASTKLYGEVGGKPCMAEEIGTMGPMICSDENAAKFLRVNLFSLWANGAWGVMWWCANDQMKLSKFPYSENTCEVELGMLRGDHSPKPVMYEMKKFSDFLKENDFELPAAEYDGVCILTHEQEQWGVGYMTHILMRQAGLNIRFSFADCEIPDSKLYLLPSVNGKVIMNKDKLYRLFERVYEGADLYISADDVVIPEFERFCGMKIEDSYAFENESELMLEGKKIEIKRNRKFFLSCAGADVLACDSEGNPAITVYSYGKGRVFYVNFPLEKNLINRHDAFSGNDAEIYKLLFGEYLDKKEVKITGENIAVTYHCGKNEITIVAVNHSGKEVIPDIQISQNYKADRIYYGKSEKIDGFDALVMGFKKIQI